MDVSSQTTLAAIKVTNSSANSDLNFVKIFTLFPFLKKYFARINFDETRSEERSQHKLLLYVTKLNFVIAKTIFDALKTTLNCSCFEYNVWGREYMRKLLQVFLCGMWVSSDQ